MIGFWSYGWLGPAFVFKIVLTLGWGLVPLFAPRCLFEAFGIADQAAIGFAKLMGVGFTALLVGYGFGLAQLVRGRFPFEAVVVGVVSNGLACLTLIYLWLATGFGGFDKSAFLTCVMVGSTFATGIITGWLSLGLIRHSRA